ncbi:Sulfotransferase domain protein [Falsiruegeria litorea R37]|uniref:Sulfotransferase domain protein n=1 Tax=Falsiruegeria litorea R37 TaxID=1200284 RepID=A0A1Y5RY68_9RHOB|nr:sulfotransferase domain-containing protein [Falsiruegeria litorea]SLN26872.1 Sulfotransferase domain protein [Falsiruegeria litorea R37]
MTLPRLPSLIIAGVPKAGTTSIFDWLGAHPQAQGSTLKETCFFADPDSHAFRPDFNSDLGLDTYRSVFPDPATETKVLFEATPLYIYSARALEQIPELPSKPKCLFVLREPAAQIRSIYHYFRNTWTYVPAEMSFADYLSEVRNQSHEFGGNELARNALINADYAPWLLQWRSRLGPERMKVCLFEDLRRNPCAFMTNLSRWCGLDPHYYANFSFDASNESYEVVNRSLHGLNMAVRDHLPKGRLYNLARDFYRRFNTRPVTKEVDAENMQRLRREFAPTYATLEQAFDLNLDAWRK